MYQRQEEFFVSWKMNLSQQDQHACFFNNWDFFSFFFFSFLLFSYLLFLPSKHLKGSNGHKTRMQLTSLLFLLLPFSYDYCVDIRYNTYFVYMAEFVEKNKTLLSNTLKYKIVYWVNKWEKEVKRIHEGKYRVRNPCLRK